LAISDESLEAIKELKISSVLENQGIRLKRVGREFVTQCCWHSDTNPSLTISDDKGFLFCHVCREGGDVIKFFMKKYGLSFRDACEKIAGQNNLYLNFKEEDPEKAAERKKLIANALSQTTRQQSLYRSSLKGSTVAIDFIKDRKILPETSRLFGLGFDRNQNRITIPIQNRHGDIVGFTARSIGEEKPKYKNTANNEIFTKSDLVFNEFNATESIRELDYCIFVEGHFDVISMRQAGFANCVAIQGTASPSDQVIERLSRKSNKFILCMDADAGGVKAVGLFLQSIQKKALRGDLDVKIAVLQGCKDPDEAIKLGLDMHNVISNASPWIDWILDQWLGSLDFSDQSKLQDVEKKIKALLSQISSAALRTHYFDKCAIALAQNRQNVAAQILKNFLSGTKLQSKSSVWHKPEKGWTRQEAEKKLLRLYIHHNDLRQLLRPMMEFLIVPDMIWLWNRILELESHYTIGFTKESLMAILAVAEPIYMQKLRPITVPTISISSSLSVVMHIEDVMFSQSALNA
jgi:DNA primase